MPTDTSFEARQSRLTDLWNTPAVSTPTGGEPEKTKGRVRTFKFDRIVKVEAL